MKAPCGDCPDKGCGNHGNCDKYLEFQAHCEAQRKKNFDDRMIDGYTVREVIKAKRISRRWNKR